MQNRRSAKSLFHVVYLGVICLLCINLCQAEKAAADKREELQRKRLAVLEEALKELANSENNVAFASLSEVRDGELAVLKAKMDLASNREDRTSIANAMVSVVEKYLATVEMEAKTTGVSTHLDVLRAKALTLEYQILRERINE